MDKSKVEANVLEEKKQKFIKDLELWLGTDQHRFDCAAFSEGQYCCLDKEQEGRQFILEWMNKNL